MKTRNEIKQIAQQTIITEYLAIQKMADYVDDDFAQTVELIYRSQGRVVITGIGKSANIAQKIVATLNSTGTPSVFMHAADAIHGDLGIVQNDDVVLCISKSGNTPEIKVLVPLIRHLGNKLIAMVSNADSYLAQQADFVLRATVDKEACPNNLAPTSSTTAQLVMGDALAVCLLESREFTSADFAKYHPGGALGKQLYLRVGDLFKNNSAPHVASTDRVDRVILEISSNRLGATAVLNAQQELVGIITDGDLRRMLQQRASEIVQLTAQDIMSASPKVVPESMLAVKAFELMKKNHITQLIVAEQNKYLGIVHLHDILKEGIV